MSTLTDQIKAKCTTIAQNTKKIFDKGYAEGRASVKHITFSIYLPSRYDPNNEISYFCAFADMTWREYVASDMSNGMFVIKDEKALYKPSKWSEYYLGCDADDEIIDKMEYNALYNIISHTKEPFYVFSSYSMGENLSLYNQDRYYIDDRGFIRATDGRLLLAAEGFGGYWIVKATEHPDMEMYSYNLTPDTDLIIFHLGYHDTAVKRGFTWAEFCGSDYANYHYYVSGDTITTEGGEIVQLNGVNVKPSDVIIENADYSYYYE